MATAAARQEFNVWFVAGGDGLVAAIGYLLYPVAAPTPTIWKRPSTPGRRRWPGLAAISSS
jgi:hypothetical protein